MGNTGSCVGRSSSTPKKAKGGDAPAATRHGIPLAPGRPRLREATQTSLHVEWDKPASDGGSTIFAYIVKMSRAEGSAWRKLDADCEGLDYLAKNLEPGEAYKFYVQCENDNGVSKPSEISDLFTTKTYEIVTTPVQVGGDVNENVKETFGSSAEKYVKTEEDDNKSEASEHSHKSNKSEQSHHSKSSAKSESSKDSGHSKDSQKSQDEDDQGSHNSHQSDGVTEQHVSEEHVSEQHVSEQHVSGQHVVVTKTIETSTIVTAVSNEKEFSVTADDDVGHGKPLNLGAYSYSSDSLLDEEEAAETVHRFPPHDGDAGVQPSYHAAMEEYQAYDNAVPDEHRDVIMDLQYLEIDPNDYNRLSIISERSVEESVGTPDASSSSPTKDGTHFTFVKKFQETSTNVESGADYHREVEETRTKVSGTEMSTVVITRSQTESKPMETRIPMMTPGKTTTTCSSSSTVTKQVNATVKDVKIQSKLPTIRKEEKVEEANTSYSEERKSSIPELERKSSIPKLAATKITTATTKVEEKVKTESKVESKIPSRRGSAGKADTGICKPSPSRSSGDQSPSTSPATPASPASGIAVRARTAKESPKHLPVAGSRLPSPGTKSGIPPPRVNISAS